MTTSLSCDAQIRRVAVYSGTFDPVTLGHEIAGRVEEIGTGVDTVDVGDLVMDLIELEAARIEADTTPYRFVTAFTARGLDEAMALGHQAVDIQAQATAIRQALDACPKGRAGRECRERERARMKALEDGFRDQALDYGRRHGLPVDD